MRSHLDTAFYLNGLSSFRGTLYADELLAALLGNDPSLEPLKPLLIERTEGNPFFPSQLSETGRPEAPEAANP